MDVMLNNCQLLGETSEGIEALSNFKVVVSGGAALSVRPPTVRTLILRFIPAPDD